ncbi:MAG: hydroxymethylbilane synthase [Myxococcota bacterium]|jgi:hydroxymethylbilane synthase
MSRPSLDRLLRIGTRGSKLALTQSGWVRDRLAAAGMPGELVIIKTTGDMIQDRPLQAIGGKGLFLKEIEEALLAETIDIAVHSMKDMPSDLPMGLRIASIPEREDPRDVLIPHDTSVRSLDELPQGSLVATGSTRRQAQLARLRPDLRFTGMRGNVDTRLRKVRAGEGGIDATVLAAAGLHRIGADVPEAIYMDPSLMLPAVGQGTLAIEARIDAFELETALLSIHHTPTATCASAERAFLERLEGDCKTPIAGYAQIIDGQVTLTGIVSGPNGTPWFEKTLASPEAWARRTGGALGEQLLAEGAGRVLAGG